MSNYKLSPESKKHIDRMSQLNNMLSLLVIRDKWEKGQIHNKGLLDLCDKYFKGRAIIPKN